MHYYCMYGVGFESEFVIYNIAETDCVPQVSIVRISDGYDMGEMQKKNINYKILPNGVWFANRYGQFFVLDGKRIEVLPAEDADDMILSTFICGWCMAFLFAQRGFSAIHCTALEMKGGCVIISGGSGSGKSTTATELIDRGYRYLCDDIAMVSPANGYMVEPAYPLQKICRDVLEKNGVQSTDTMLYVDSEKDKFARTNLDDFCSESREFKTFFLLQKGNVSSVQAEELTGLNKLLKMMSGLFLTEMYAGAELPPNEQFRMLQIAGHVRVVSIVRPENGDTLKEVADIIEKWS